MNPLDNAESRYEAAMAKFSKVHSDSTKLKATYRLNYEEEQKSGIIDSYRFPDTHLGDVIHPSDVHRQDMSNSVTWIIAMNKVFNEIKLRTSDTIVHVGAGDGRWLVEAALRHKCHCVGVDVEYDIQYRCESKFDEQEISELLEYEVVESLLDADLTEATAVLVSNFNDDIKGLREKLEAEVGVRTPIVIIGGQQILGWFPHAVHKHRGVKMFIYLKRTLGTLAQSEVGAFRQLGEYLNPNDMMQRLSIDNSAADDDAGEDDKYFHLEDVGTKTRDESLEPNVSCFTINNN